MSPPNSRCNLSRCVMIWSKLKADSDYEVPCPIPLFIRDRACLKKAATHGKPRKTKAVRLFCHSMLGDFFVVYNAINLGKSHPSFSVDFERAFANYSFPSCAVKMRKIRLILLAELLLIEVFLEQSIICTSRLIHTEYSGDQLKGIN